MAAEDDGFHSRCGCVHGMDECVWRVGTVVGPKLSLSPQPSGWPFLWSIGWKVRPDQLRPAHRNEVIAALSLLVCCLTSSRYQVHVLSSSIAHMLECGVSADLRRNASLPPVPIGFVSPLMTSISRPYLVCWRRILPLSAASEAPRLQTTYCDAILGAIPSVTYRQYIVMTTKKDPSALDPLYENDRRSAQCNRDPSLACSDLAA